MNKDHKLLSYTTVFCMICLCSCTKSIYTFSDAYGWYSFTLYKTNFKYEAATTFSRFKVKGKYEIKNEVVFFDWNIQDSLPYYYQSNTYQLLEQRPSQSYLEFSVRDKISHEPLIYVPIIFRDSNMKIIGSAETDFDGNVFTVKNDSIDVIEIKSPSFANHVVRYKELKDHRFICELMPLAQGGRMSDGCLILFLDVILEYKAEKEGDRIIQLEQNGKEFRLLKN